jgi:hypothetical protein
LHSNQITPSPFPLEKKKANAEKNPQNGVSPNPGWYKFPCEKQRHGHDLEQSKGLDTTRVPAPCRYTSASFFLLLVLIHGPYNAQ